MQSHELLREVLQKTSAKQIAADLGLSLSMIYKWAEPDEGDGSGTVNPLDRIEQLLASTKDKAAVVRVLQHRGVAPESAQELVQTVYKRNLWENRKTALGAAVVSGLIAVGLVVVWIATDRLFYVWLPIAALAAVWSTIKCLTASGYELEDSED